MDYFSASPPLMEFVIVVIGTKSSISQRTVKSVG